RIGLHPDTNRPLIGPDVKEPSAAMACRSAGRFKNLRVYLVDGSPEADSASELKKRDAIRPGASGFPAGGFLGPALTGISHPRTQPPLTMQRPPDCRRAVDRCNPISTPLMRGE